MREKVNDQRPSIIECFTYAGAKAQRATVSRCSWSCWPFPCGASQSLFNNKMLTLCSARIQPSDLCLICVAWTLVCSKWPMGVRFQDESEGAASCVYPPAGPKWIDGERLPRVYFGNWTIANKSMTPTQSPTVAFGQALTVLFKTIYNWTFFIFLSSDLKSTTEYLEGLSRSWEAVSNDALARATKLQSCTKHTCPPVLWITRYILIHRKKKKHESLTICNHLIITRLL